MSYRRRLMLLAALAVTLAVALASVVIHVSVRAQLRDSVDDGLRSLSSRVQTAPQPRPPLATVQANVELLSRASELPVGERRQLREDLLSQLRELTGLVGDLVELAREQAPESELEVLDLAQLAAGCVERARGHSPRVRFDCDLRS